MGREGTTEERTEERTEENKEGLLGYKENKGGTTEGTTEERTEERTEENKEGLLGYKENKEGTTEERTEGLYLLLCSHKLEGGGDLYILIFPVQSLKALHFHYYLQE